MEVKRLIYWVATVCAIVVERLGVLLGYLLCPLMGRRHYALGRFPGPHDDAYAITQKNVKWNNSLNTGPVFFRDFYGRYFYQG
jgi:hypothetical protein